MCSQERSIRDPRTPPRACNLIWRQGYTCVPKSACRGTRAAERTSPLDKSGPCSAGWLWGSRRLVLTRAACAPTEEYSRLPCAWRWVEAEVHLCGQSICRENGRRRANEPALEKSGPCSAGWLWYPYSCRETKGVFALYVFVLFFNR